MSNGWIWLHRKLIDWEWYTSSQMVHLFIHLLLRANHEDAKWKGHNIKRGQLLTGLFSLKSQTGISTQSLRTCLQRLKSTSEITIQSTNQFSLITIVNYNSYQLQYQKSTDQSTSQLTNDQQATNKRSTTNNKDNKNNNKNTYCDCVLLTDLEYQKLITQFGENGAKQRIQRLNNYVLSKGKKYSSHYATILVWEDKNIIINEQQSQTEKPVELCLNPYTTDETL